MLIRIISLVFLLIYTTTSVVISAENNDFIYPLNKPSVFKKLDKKDIISKEEIITKRKT